MNWYKLAIYAGAGLFVLGQVVSIGDPPQARTPELATARIIFAGALVTLVAMA